MNDREEHGKQGTLGNGNSQQQQPQQLWCRTNCQRGGGEARGAAQKESYYVKAKSENQGNGGVWKKMEST